MRQLSKAFSTDDTQESLLGYWNPWGSYSESILGISEGMPGTAQEKHKKQQRSRKLLLLEREFLHSGILGKLKNSRNQQVPEES